MITRFSYWNDKDDFLPIQVCFNFGILSFNSRFLIFSFAHVYSYYKGNLKLLG
nr:MAG TPA: hypothetical protein [Ackermannviridae sp.]